MSDQKDMVKAVKNTFLCVNAVSGNGKCKHDFQDKVHGKNMRVHTTLGGGTNAGNNKKRCTVCDTMSA